MLKNRVCAYYNFHTRTHPWCKAGTYYYFITRSYVLVVRIKPTPLARDGGGGRIIYPVYVIIFVLTRTYSLFISNTLH